MTRNEMLQMMIFLHAGWLYLLMLFDAFVVNDNCANNKVNEITIIFTTKKRYNVLC